MTAERQGAVWAAAFAAFCLILWTLADVLAPFLAGLAIAYFLDPAADRLERAGLPRLAAVSIITLIGVLITVLAVALAAPVIAGQLIGLAESVPSLAAWLRAIAPQALDAVAARLPESLNIDLTPWTSGPGDGAGAHLAPGGALESALQSVAASARDAGASIARNLFSGGLAAVGLIAKSLIALVVAFYMLLDWDKMIAAINGWLPRPHAAEIRRIARNIDEALSGFVRGQVTVCVVMAIYYSFGLSAAGLKYGFLIGIFTGLMTFIPFVGSSSGLLLSMGVALSQFWGDWTQIALVAAVFFAGQLVEGNILSPKLVGGKVGLHPVWLIFALSAFGSLFGFTGMLVAVPVAASIGVLARYGLERYFDSRLYHGPDAGPDDESG